MASRFGLEIRAATAADAPGLSELMAAVGRAVAPRVLAERLERVRQSPGVVLLALEWGPPSGVVSLAWRRTLLADTLLAEIDLLAVAPPDRRRGVGRLLLKAGSQAARLAGCAGMVLDVPSEAADLQAFCRATGFDAAGARFARPLRKKG